MPRPIRTHLHDEIDSDADSVATNSTAESEPKEVYDVRRILAEAEDRDGTVYYLIDWDGYPIERASWEPENALMGDTLKRQWQITKTKIAHGREDPFDVGQWEQDKKIREENKLRRKARREAKRKRKRNPVPTTLKTRTPSRRKSRPTSETASKADSAATSHEIITLDSQSSENEIFNEPRAKRTQQRDLNDFVVTDDESGSDASDPVLSPRKRAYSLSELSSATNDSHMEELRLQQKLAKIEDQKKRAKTMSRNGNRSQKAENRTNVSQKMISDLPTITSASSQHQQSKSGLPVHTHQPAVPISGGIVSSKIPENESDKGMQSGKSKKTGAAVFAEWDNNDARRPPTRRSALDPGTEINKPGSKRFSTLSKINRIEKAGRNEPVPRFEDVRYLAQVNENLPAPATSPTSPGLFVADTSSATPEADNGQVSVFNLGKFNPQPVSSYSRQLPTSVGPQKVSDAFRLRPRREEQERELLASCERAEPNHEKASQATTDLGPKPGMRVPLTCYNWHQTRCNLSEDECPFIHENTDQIAPPDLLDQWMNYNKPPKFTMPRRPALTCAYWYRGSCKKDLVFCDFAHWNTGLLANPQNPSTPIPIPLEIKTKAMERRQSLSAATEDGALCDISMPKGPSNMRNPSFRSGSFGARRPLIGPETPKCHFYHKLGNCKKGEACHYRHDVDVTVSSKLIPRRNQTCWFWRTKGCKHSDDKCPYAHKQMELNALPPPSITGEDHFITTDSLDVTHNSSKTPEEAATSPRPSTGAKIASAKPSQPLAIDTTKPIISLKQTPVVTPAEGITFLDMPHEVAVRLHIPGSQDDGVDVLLELNTKYRDRFRNHTKNDIRVEFSVTAADFQYYISGREILVGNISSTNPNILSIMETYACHLSSHAIGGIAFHEELAMVIFPEGREVWSFLKSKAKPSGRAVLGFGLLTGLPKPPQAWAITPPSIISYHEALTRISKTTPEQFFKLNEFDLDRSVFLLFDPGRKPELDFWERCLHAIKAKTYRSDNPGAWDYWSKENKSGVLLICSEMMLFRIPNMSFVAGNKISVFELKYDEQAEMYDCHRLLPHGGLVLITDDLLEYHPDQTVRIVKDLVHRNNNSNNYSKLTRRSWRLATRPGIKLWLMNKIVELGDRRSSRKDLYVDLLEQLLRLVPAEDWDVRDGSEPSGKACLITPAPSEIPDYDAVWDRDESATHTLLVDWFARLAALSVRSYRRFVVVHGCEQPEWKQGYTMMDIVTPAKYEKKYGRDGANKNSSGR